MLESLFISIMLSLEWFHCAPPGQVLGTSLPVPIFGEGSAAHSQHLQSTSERGSLCVHMEAGIPSLLPCLQTLPKTTQWICPAVVRGLSGIHVSCKIRGLFLVRQWIWNTATAVYSVRNKSLFSKKAMTIVYACPNGSVSGSRGIQECWSLLWVSFRHWKTTI